MLKVSFPKTQPVMWPSPLVLHRPIKGTPKTATIRRGSTGKWYVCFWCESRVLHLRHCATGQQVGIDVGLKTFATPSTGQEIANPHIFCHDEKALASIQRRLAKEAKGRPELARRHKVVAQVHGRIAWRRGDFAH
jgi:putative transposase